MITVYVVFKGKIFFIYPEEITGHMYEEGRATVDPAFVIYCVNSFSTISLKKGDFLALFYRV